MATPTLSTGRVLLEMTASGGAMAAGRQSGAIRPGGLADLMALDESALDLAGKTGDDVLDSFIFAGDDRMIRDVWAAGRHLVKGGRHIRRDAIVGRYRTAMTGLRTRI